jgi:diguanylate cyclase (GGDEF)-like protein
LFEGKRLKVTASLGVAEFGVGETPAKVIRRADEAVYAAKNAGRNNTHWHDGIECQPLTAGNSSTASAKPTPPHASVPSPAQAAATHAPLAPTSADSSMQMPDRVVFAGELRRRVAESHRFGVSLSVMHLRIKDYDRLEATYGQAMASMVLDSVAGFVRSGLRDMDLLAKYDQDEFVVMLPGSSENEAKQVGRRIKASIAACSIPLGAAEIKLDLHIGVSHVQSEDDAEKLITRARRVMQAAATLDRELAEA